MATNISLRALPCLGKNVANSLNRDNYASHLKSLRQQKNSLNTSNLAYILSSFYCPLLDVWLVVFSKKH
jgi:hypothetical protein